MIETTKMVSCVISEDPRHILGDDKTHFAEGKQAWAGPRLRRPETPPHLVVGLSQFFRKGRLPSGPFL